VGDHEHRAPHHVRRHGSQFGALDYRLSAGRGIALQTGATMMNAPGREVETGAPAPAPDRQCSATSGRCQCVKSDGHDGGHVCSHAMPWTTDPDQ
jgi:hypothetical protein